MDFLEYLKINVRESTFRTYESCYRRLEKMDLSDTEKVYDKILEMKSTAQNNFIRTLNQYEKYSKSGKTWKSTKVREEDRRIKEEYLGLEDILKMIKGAKTIRIKAEIATMYGTGIRINELRTVRHQDLDPIGKRIVGVKAKGNKRTNAYFIDNYFYEILKDYLTWKINNELYTDLCKNDDYIFCDGTGKPYTNQTIWNDIKKTARILKDKKSISPHTLRHSFVYSAMEQGIPQDAISKNIGHSSTLVTEKIYTHYTQDLQQKRFFGPRSESNSKKHTICPNCGFNEIEDDFLLCPQCQYRFKIKCGKCLNIYKVNYPNCPYCPTKNPEYMSKKVKDILIKSDKIEKIKV